MTQSASLHPLHRADGSATHTTPHLTILAAVNGPVEVSRRDELPDASFIEVNVRPASGVGGPRERWLESVVASTLRAVVLTHLHPRTLVQVTLQVVKDVDAEAGGVKLRKGIKDVVVIPSLVNAAFAALVDSGLPLERTVVAGLGTVGNEGEIAVEPSAKEIAACKSVHAMAFAMVGEEQSLLLNESAGVFGLEEWEKVEDMLRERAVTALEQDDEDEDMEGSGSDIKSNSWLRKAVEESVQKGEAWKEAG